MLLSSCGNPREAAADDRVERNGADHGAAHCGCHTLKPAAVDCNSGSRSIVCHRRTSHEGRLHLDHRWLYSYNGQACSAGATRISAATTRATGVTAIAAPSLKPEIAGVVYAAHRNRILVDGSATPLPQGPQQGLSRLALG